MSNANTMQIVTNLVELLAPLNSEERKRVISASLMLLGDTPISAGVQNAKNEDSNHQDSELPQRAQLWAKQNQLGFDAIEQVFHIRGSDVDVIAHEIPGKNGKEKTLNAYILTGIASLLRSGEATFEDKNARALCKSAGCYSDANHATYLKDKGNEIAGSKDRGWTLTAPGLKRGAILVKDLTSAGGN